ncbi:MAG: aldo/keto reductase [Gemmatimonadaceae bacterium]|nr:aldo/keto reductase [Gemmatimonadaceae bacterium]
MTTTSPRPRAAMLTGRATAAGTARYGARAAAKLAADYLRPLTHDGVLVSSIGLGSYLGECDEADDIRYADTAHHALATGINLLDTAINYRCQRSERSFGKALSRAVRMETAARDEIIVCTKGGYIPLDGTQPATREEYQEYVKREYIDSGILRADEIVAGGHCLSPAFLADQISRSRANLGIETIDLYYLHNPEQQLDAVDEPELQSRLRSAFELLEQRCAAGEIGGYGCATWNGLRTAPGERGHLSLAMLVQTAREVGGTDHHFQAVQLPVNLALNEAVRTPTQRIDDRELTVLEAASELGVAVVASATLLQAKLASKLPQQMREALPGLTTDAQRAIAFVRGLPVIASALVGMRSAGHVRENLGAARASNSALSA